MFDPIDQMIITGCQISFLWQFQQQLFKSLVYSDILYRDVISIKKIVTSPKYNEMKNDIMWHEKLKQTY